jgi:ATP-binding cassette subfamily C (CFTR/MRP) protein 1
MNASLAFFSTTDSGAITNRFSQDMELVDMELPLGLLNVVLSLFSLFGQIFLITVSSPWAGLAFPFILAIVYAVHGFYLRTSRQLRLMDIDAKSPLYTNFLETLSGLPTIRAFGWTQKSLEQGRKLLDQSQEPAYLLRMIQRWLILYVDLIVACVALIVVTLSVVRWSDAGITGVAVTQVLSMSLVLRMTLITWTSFETSTGAIARVKNFTEQTPSEHKECEVNEPPLDWPHTGKIEFVDVTAFHG